MKTLALAVFALAIAATPSLAAEKRHFTLAEIEAILDKGRHKPKPITRAEQLACYERGLSAFVVSRSYSLQMQSEQACLETLRAR